MLRVRGAFVLAAFAAMLVALPASGQDQGKIAKIPPETRAKIQTEYMAEKLGLSADEKTKVQAINVKFAEKMQPVLDGSLGPFARMREGRKLEKEKEAELKTVLTGPQFEKFQTSKAEMKDKIKAKLMEKASEGQ